MRLSSPAFLIVIGGVMGGVGCQSILGIGETTLVPDVDASSGMPDAPPNPPDAPPLQPDAPSNPPDAPSNPPDAAPDAPVAVPDAVVPVPDAHVSPADATVTTPDGTVSRPDAPLPPDASPDAPPVPPDARPDAPLPPDGMPDASVVTGDFTLMLGTAWVVHDGHTPGTLQVSVNRVGGFDGEITVMLVSPPAGISGSTITIPAGMDTGALSITAAPSVSLGPTAVAVRAQSGTIMHQMSASVVIADPPGTVDTTFASSGIYQSCVGTCTFQSGTALVIQSDDGIVVGGTTANGFLVNRFHADGTVDDGYGTNGAVDITGLPIGGVEGIAPGPAGSILVTGFITEPRGAMFRVMAGGQIDGAFGTSGPTTILGSPGTGLGMLSGGDIIYAELPVHSGSDSVVKRIDPLGKMAEADFAGGTGAVVETHLHFRGVAVLPDDSFETAGNDGSHVVALHFDATGAPVDGFGTDGFATLSDTWVPLAFLPLPDRYDLLVGGPSGAGGQFVVDGLDGGGGLDPDFAGGRLTGMVGATGVTAMALGVQADGKLLVGATAGTTTKIFRYSKAGVLDQTFGTNGSIGFPIQQTPIVAIGRQADGRVILLGSLNSKGYVLVRIWP